MNLNQHEQVRQSQINDIRSMVFDGEVQEIVTSMMMLTVMMENSVDAEIIGHCRVKLKAGHLALMEMGETGQAEHFKNYLID